MKSRIVVALLILAGFPEFVNAQQTSAKDPVLERANTLLRQSQFQHYKAPVPDNPQYIRDQWALELQKLRNAQIRSVSLRVNMMPSYAQSTAYANAIVGQPLDVWGNAWGGSGSYLYRIEFGDGAVDSGSVSDYRNISFAHTYETANTYVARLRIYDTADTTFDEDQTVIRVFATPTGQIRVNMAIEKGLKYLYLYQYSDGSWSGNTGSCVLAFSENGHKPFNDFDRDIYAETVNRGLGCILTNGWLIDLNTQPYGNPDLNGDGKGVILVDNSYQQGLDLLGIISCGSRSWAEHDTVTTGPLAGWTILKIVENAVEDIIWSQTESGWARGGWRYYVSGADPGDADNSAVAWLTLSLEAAQNLWNIQIPQWMKNELQIWLQTSQDADGGFGYQGTNWRNTVKTGSGIGSYGFIGADTSNAAVKKALVFLNTHWNDTYDSDGWPEIFNGNIYAMWGLAKSFRIINNRQGITHVGNHDWYVEFVSHLLDNPAWKQHENGEWPQQEPYFPGGHLATAFGVLILTQSVGVALPVAVIDPAGPFPQGLGFRLNGSRSFHLDPNRHIVQYEWDWNSSNGMSWDSGPADAVGPQPFNPGYGQPGVYRITLRVADDNAPPLINTKTIDIVVSDTGHHPPIAVAGPPTGYNAKVGIPILLDGRHSYSPDSSRGVTIVGYSWDLNGDGVFGDATTDTVSVMFSEAKSSLISLRVYDSRGDSSFNLAEVKVTAAQNNIQVVGLTVEPSDLFRGGTISMSALATVDATSDLSSFANVELRFYLGDPFTTGTQIGATHLLSLEKGRIDTVRDQGIVPHSVQLGANKIFVYLDARETYSEFNEADNLADADFRVRAPKVKLAFDLFCLNFATVQENEIGTQIVTIQNDTTAEGDLKIDSIVVDPISSGYSYDSTAMIIQRGGSWTITVHFTPLQSGEAFAVLHLYTSDPEKPIHDIMLHGFGDLPSTGVGQTIYSGLARFEGKTAPPHSVVEAYRVVGTGDTAHTIFVRSALVVPVTNGNNFSLSLLEGQAGLANNDKIIFKLILPNCNGPYGERVCIPERASVFLAENPAAHFGNVFIEAVSEHELRIPILAGYNSVSWNVQPPAVGVSDLFGSMIEKKKVQVVLEYKNDGIANPEYLWYIPQLGKYNPLQQTDWRKGYFVKLLPETSDTLVVQGIPVCAEIPLTIQRGYNFISYLPDVADSAWHVFNAWHSDTGFVAAFDYINDGAAARFDVFPMGDFRLMKPGKGYFVQRKTGPVQFTYPSFIVPPEESAPVQFAASLSPGKKSTSLVQSLPMIMLAYGTDLSLNGQKIPSGSYLKAMTKSGIPCGESRFIADGVVSMAISADDPGTVAVEGARVGEQVVLSVNDRALNRTIPWTTFGDVIDLNNLFLTSAAEIIGPIQFALYPAYPNPFNPATEIRYDIAMAVPVQIRIYNSIGQLVRTLVNEQKPNGNYSVVWDGRNDVGSQMSSGIYICRMIAGSFVKSQKMMLLK